MVPLGTHVPLARRRAVPNAECMRPARVWRSRGLATVCCRPIHPHPCRQVGTVWYRTAVDTRWWDVSFDFDLTRWVTPLLQLLRVP
jgi:hypothetical protein